MTTDAHDNDITRASALAQRFLSGQVSRRDLLRRSAVFGGAALGATALGPLLAACGPSSGASAGASAATGKPVSGGTLVAALTGNPSSMDPAASGVYTSAQVSDNIFSKLVVMDETGKITPDLAKSWKQSDDKTYTFELVDNATFHNGEKFTADDVKYTFERIADPKTASTYASSFSAVKSIEVVSPTEVTFHLSEPFAPFLNNLAQNGQIVNKKAIESSDPTRKPVGTGPFVFGEWVQSDHITLKKNPKYFRAGQPYLDEITFRFLNVDNSRIASLQSGQVDWVDAVPLDQLKTLKDNPSYRYVTSKVAGIPDFIAMNAGAKPFNNKALRQAVQAAMDRSEILNIAYFGAGETGAMEVPSGSQWFGGKDPYASGPDLEVARQKMIEAGYPNGLTVPFLALPQYPELQKTAVVLKDQLAKIGIDLKIQQQEVTVWFDAYAKGDYQMTAAYWAGTIDPDNFYSTQLVTGSPNNYCKYSNPKMDSLIAQARSTTDAAARKSLYEQIRAILWEDAPLVFSHYETVNYLMRKNVFGSTINPPLELNLGNVWKTK